MASTFHSLRRTVSLSSSLFHRSLHRLPSHPNIFRAISAATTTAVSTAEFPQSARSFTSTTTLFQPDERKPFNPETVEMGPDTILFEGCDYNHWLITVDFPKDTELTREQKIEFYVNIAAQVFGSVEEAKKKIYSVSTTTYEGFQVECSEETSNKFQNIPGVVFVLPDSYIDPVNKEYGGDKYVNGEIFPRPPPIHFRRNNRERRPRNSESRSYGPDYGPTPQQQNYGPPTAAADLRPPTAAAELWTSAAPAELWTSAAPAELWSSTAPAELWFSTSAAGLRTTTAAGVWACPAAGLCASIAAAKLWATATTGIWASTPTGLCAPTTT